MLKKVRVVHFQFDRLRAGYRYRLTQITPPIMSPINMYGKINITCTLVYLFLPSHFISINNQLTIVAAAAAVVVAVVVVISDYHCCCYMIDVLLERDNNLMMILAILSFFPINFNKSNMYAG